MSLFAYILEQHYYRQVQVALDIRSVRFALHSQLGAMVGSLRTYMQTKCEICGDAAVKVCVKKM